MFPAIKDALISLSTVALTLLYEYVRLEIDDRTKAKALLHNTTELMAKLEVQFDLLLIAATLILGAWISGKNKNSGQLVPPAIALGIALLLILGLFTPASEFSDPYYLLRVWIPDAIGLGLVAWAVSAVRS